jgi:hypothetical protein
VHKLQDNDRGRSPVVPTYQREAAVKAADYLVTGAAGGIGSVSTAVVAAHRRLRQPTSHGW